MKVTNVFFKELKPGGKLLAYASVEFDNTFSLNGFKIFNGTNGIFAVVPQEQRDEKYYDNLRWSDKSFYEKGSEAHPLLKEVIEHWTRFKGNTPKEASKKSKESGDLPW